MTFHHQVSAQIPPATGPTHRSTAGTPIAVPMHNGDDLLSLLITLLPDVQRTSILVALSTYAANAILRRETAAGYHALIKFFPRESSTLMLATMRLSRFYPASPLCSPLTDFCSKLSHAKAATLRFAADRVAMGCPDGDANLNLRHDWCDAASASQSLLKALQKALIAFEISANDEEPVYSLLENSVNGHVGPVDATGHVVMPEWAERRKSRRVSICCPAIIRVREQSFSATLRNISNSGIGLETTSVLRVGEVVEIRVGQSVSLEATVVWSNGREAGLEFKRPIQTDDPRFKFCSEPSLARSRINTP